MVKMLSSEKIIGEKYRFTLLTPSLIRLEYSEEGIFVDEQTQVVLNRDFPIFEYDVDETAGSLKIQTESFRLFYDKKEFSSQGLSVDMKSNYTDFDNRWFYGKEFETLKGTVRTLDQVDGEVLLDEGIISKQGYALLDDSDSFIINDQGEKVVRNGEDIDLYFFGYQRKYKEAIKDFYKLTGPTPIIPRFALGNWWSRFWAYTDEEYLNLMDLFRAESIPLSVSVIDMDWHIRDIPKRFGSSWTGYTWNKKLFPEPSKFMEALHRRGLKVSLNVHPADGIRAFEDSYPAVAERLKLNVSLEEPAEFDMTDKNFVESYFKDVHHPLENQGVDFWWIDWQQGSESRKAGFDPLWLLNEYHFEDNKNGLILSRYAGPGSHRYPVGFSGDTIITWESLQFQPYFTATASNIGYSWWSHDIGGHMDGSRDDELTLRWMQFGTFSPINRLHSSSSPFNSKEPWKFTSQIQGAMKESLRMRHRLLPYLYAENVKLSEDGSAFVEPLYYNYPNDLQAYEYRNQYMFGSELLVTPVVHPTNKKYKFAKENIWLPKGIWYDFHTGHRYEGDTELSIFRKIDEIGVFAKAGAIIPMDPNFMETNPNELPEIIEWKVFPGQSNEYHLVEDMNEKRCTTILKMDWEKRKITLTISGKKEILPKKRKNILSLYCVMGEDGTSFVNNRYVTEIESEVTLKINEVDKQSMDSMVFERIDLPDIAYATKNELWENLKKINSLTKKLNAVKRFKDPALIELLYEAFYIEES